MNFTQWIEISIRREFKDKYPPKELEDLIDTHMEKIAENLVRDYFKGEEL